MTAYLCFSKYKYWAECLFAEIKPRCSEAAAEYVVTYLLQGWRPYLYYHYRCHLGKITDIFPNKYVLAALHIIMK